MEGIFNKRIHWDKSEVEGVAVPGIELSVRVVPHSAFQTEDRKVRDISYIALKFSTTSSEQQTLVQISSPLFSAAKKYRSQKKLGWMQHSFRVSDHPMSNFFFGAASYLELSLHEQLSLEL
jgi:hypothetical protein